MLYKNLRRCHVFFMLILYVFLHFYHKKRDWGEKTLVEYFSLLPLLSPILYLNVPVSTSVIYHETHKS